MSLLVQENSMGSRSAASAFSTSMGTLCLSCQMESGQVAERHGGADGPARTGIGMAHHRRADITCGVEPFDHGVVVTQCTAVHIGADAALRAEIAGNHLGRVERAVLDLAQVGVGLVGRV